MNKEQTNDSPPSIFRRILQSVGLTFQPDTHEELEQEIQELIEEGEEQGLISSQEGKMISSIFDFRDTMIKEIMTPATDIISAPATADHCKLIKIILDKGYSRIPIYEDNPDHIIGVIHAKDLLSCSSETPLTSIKNLLQQPFFVQEYDNILSLLRDFQSQKTHMAIVTDEFGSIRGLVTLEDILEEIVGEIVDESDKEEEDWQVIDDRTLITSAKVDLDKIETFFAETFPDGPYESVGGFIIHSLGHIPETGTSIDHGPLKMHVLSATRRRIHTVKIHKSA
ncbi:MAG: HlyC/CorC family transporter [Desulfobulbaceae bacterium]|uniref:HlyC/CorC family transporter n=1 Tax=Candidatus Desulfobia pelagia TaxID=2841692 RepID=A0A8J6NF30_9BACT|nr:HlyC/CorC family transporter [Candidatus Desulfobia pelagia]